MLGLAQCVRDATRDRKYDHDHEADLNQHREVDGVVRPEREHQHDVDDADGRPSDKARHPGGDGRGTPGGQCTLEYQIGSDPEQYGEDRAADDHHHVLVDGVAVVDHAVTQLEDDRGCEDTQVREPGGSFPDSRGPTYQARYLRLLGALFDVSPD